jgi:hypothetical protein
MTDIKKLKELAGITEKKILNENATAMPQMQLYGEKSEMQTMIEKLNAIAMMEDDENNKSIPDDIIKKIFNSQYVKVGIKLPARFTIWRGVSDKSGSGMATYGTGLYTTTNKKMASQYGNVVKLDRDSLPTFPLRFDTINDFEIWIGITIDILGYDDKRDFTKDYPDLRYFISKLGYDGIQIGKGNDIFFVKYPKVKNDVPKE